MKNQKSHREKCENSPWGGAQTVRFLVRGGSQPRRQMIGNPSLMVSRSRVAQIKPDSLCTLLAHKPDSL